MSDAARPFRRDGANADIAKIPPCRWCGCDAAGAARAVLLYDGMSAFELGIVTEVFGLPRPEFDVDWYDLTICAETAEPVHAGRPGHNQTPYGLDVFAAGQTVIVPGVSDVHADPSPELVAALRRAHRRGATAGVDLLRRVRAGCRRAAGRPPGRDSLALRRPAGAAVPKGDGRRRRALRGR